MPTSLGPAEILVILVVALIVLGPKRLPEAGRQVGKAIAEVRRWSQGFQDEIRSAVDFDTKPTYPPLAPRPGVEPSPVPVAAAESPPADVAAASEQAPAATNGHVPVTDSPTTPGGTASDPSPPPAGEPPHS